MATKKTTRKKAATSASSGATKKKATKKKATKKKATTRKRTSKPRSGGDKLNHPVSVEREIGGRMLTIETGRMAKLADGACVVRYGDTVVLASAQSAQARTDIDFFPLTVDYREKTAASGRIPGGFFKREGRPSTKEILTCRIIDRSIRPMFPDGYRNECQVLSQVLATDQETESDTVAAIASFAALAVSSIPNGRTLGMCRIGYINGELVVNPTWSQVTSDDNELNLTVAGHDDAIAMVEAGAEEVEEGTMLDALELAHSTCREIVEMIDELAAKAGREKQDVKPVVLDEKLAKEIEKKYGDLLMDAPCTGNDKSERKKSISAAKAEVKEAYPVPDGASPEDASIHTKTLGEVIGKLIKKGERESILDGSRADGRKPDEIRPIEVEVGILPRVHGSVLFTRGETQALGITTLGGTDDQQIIDGLYPEPRKRFLLHYAFPPFSVGETRRMLAPGRREIGHGALAERSLTPMLPDADDFPYTIRITSEILESNGSSSMATVCAGTMSMMDAGVPIKQPVAGIAMGLVMEGKEYAILSDILGSEDACGDMDFKVSGTGKGITALQMDIKCEGLTRAILEEALDQAREGRRHILRKMLETLRQPREKLSPNAPRLESVQIPPDRIGMVIGPGGRNIRAMQEDYEVRISIEDSGVCTVAGTDSDKVEACLAYLKAMTAEVEVGTVYEGTVTAIKEFGAFIEILPSQEGMCHVSELSNEFIRSVTDVVRIGDKIEVKVIGIDDFGKVKLSRKVLLEGGDAEGAPEGDRPRGRGRGRDDEGEDRPRGRGRERGRSRRDEEGGEDRPARGRGRRDEEGEERPARGRGRRDEEAEERPARGRSRRDEEGEEDRPRRGRGRSEESDEDRPRGRGRSSRDDEGEDRPRRGRGRSEESDEDRPRGRGRSSRDDEGEDRPRRGRGRSEESDEDRPRSRGRSRSDDDGEDRPRRGRGRSEESDEDRPRGRGRSRSDDDDGDRPRRGRTEESDEDRPRGRGRSRSDDDDGDRPRGRGRTRQAEEGSGEERPARSRGRSRRDEEGDEDRPRGRSRSESSDEDRPRRRRRGEKRDDSSREEGPRDDGDSGDKGKDDKGKGGWGDGAFVGELEDAGEFLGKDEEKPRRRRRR
eukprot:jgi/Undpi1/11716/HiC_scaffold_37.g14011.m1